MRFSLMSMKSFLGDEVSLIYLNPTTNAHKFTWLYEHHEKNYFVLCMEKITNGRLKVAVLEKYK